MTVYVDNVFIPAKVGRYQDKWCHLFSFDDDPADLHALAQRIGLLRVWFQDKDTTGCRPWRNHYDVTVSMRTEATKAGAVPITFHEFSERVQAINEPRRARVEEGTDHG